MITQITISIYLFTLSSQDFLTKTSLFSYSKQFSENILE